MLSSVPGGSDAGARAVQFSRTRRTPMLAGLTRSGSGSATRLECLQLRIMKTLVSSLQEEAVEFLTQQQLEGGVQLRVQVLHGHGGQKHLL